MKTCTHLALAFAALLAAATAAAQAPQNRTPWTTSRLVGSPEPPAPYLTERVFPNLAFNQPVELVAIPGTSRLAVVEVDGKIYSFDTAPERAADTPALLADIRNREADFSRLYGLAFHPRFAENRYCYVSYVLKPKTPDASRVSRFKVLATDPPRIDPDSEQVILTWFGGGHNGAHLQFGPDGCLYVSTGDGGDSFPPDGRNSGQDLSDLEASILRIDVDQPESGRPYRIPPDNPFVGQPGARGEIWAYGLRNPWKICFDPADGSLWAGDVGWEMWEMIYHVERGGNYGWSIVEGPQPVHQERATGPTPILPPAVAHSHIEARSITGGYFSQSDRLPELRGAYLYGDYVTGKIWALRHAGPKITWRQELVDTPLQIVSFGLDHAGDVLLLDYVSGKLHRLVPNPRRTANADFPRRLSETGLFADTARHVPAPGVIPYSINAEPWADGTTAERLVALPGRTQLGVYEKSNVQIGFVAGDWAFPDGGVLAKTVSIELEPGNPASRRRLETQILHFDVDTWKAYSYVWNDAQTDAELAENVGTDRILHLRLREANAVAGGSFGDPGGNGDANHSRSAAPAATTTVRQTWHHASRTECLLCHTTRVGTVLGFKLPQLARQHDYGGTLADQLATLDRLGLFAQPLPSQPEPWPGPHDEAAPLEQRARVYLHVNCGHCHSRGGGGSSFFDVQYRLPLARTSLVGTRPTQGTFGILGAQIVAPGDPYHSVLYYRMSKLGLGRMPQFGSQVVDRRGLALLHAWIRSLAPEETPGAALVRQRAEQEAALAALAADPSVDEPVLARLLATPSGALALVTALDAGQMPPASRARAIALGTAHADSAVRDLFERFVPEEKRVQRLGTSIKPAELLALPGDAARGRTLFFQAASVQCKNCHRIGQEGQSLGPDLTQIGKKYDRARLLESILEPSKTIEPAYVPYLVEKSDGQVLSGLVVKQTDEEVVLRLADRSEVRLAASEIQRLVPQQKSLMPDLLLRDLTAQEVADLLAFLTGLK